MECDHFRVHCEITTINAETAEILGLCEFREFCV